MKTLSLSFMLLLSFASTAQKQELFSAINEYRTDVLRVSPLTYNETIQKECDSLSVLSSKKWHQYESSIEGVILSSKDIDYIFSESLKTGHGSYQLQKEAQSVCISIYKKRKNYYCVMLVELKKPDTKGVF